jgi:hypothetical protein
MRIRLSSSLAVAAVASLLFSVYVIAGDPFVNESSSSPCLTPSFGVDVYLQSVAETLVGLNNTTVFKAGACEETCKKVRGTCRGIVDSTKSCFNSAISKGVGVQEEACSQLIDSADRQACKAEANALLDDAKNFSKFDAKLAEECCEISYEPCILACMTGNTSIIQPCSDEGGEIIGCF